MTTTDSKIALLAPVPLVHLVSGREVCAEKGKVAFGSRAWHAFEELDKLRKGTPVDAYLYASHTHEPLVHEISWHERYIRCVHSIGGAHPDGMEFRPFSTAEYATDNRGLWAVFWEVEGLRELLPEERIVIREFCAFGKSKAYKRGFVPEGRLLVEHP